MKQLTTPKALRARTTFRARLNLFKGQFSFSTSHPRAALLLSTAALIAASAYLVQTLVV